MTAPLNEADISKAVGYASGDLGTLITKGIINPFAKYKAVIRAIINTSDQLNAAKTGWLDTATWWKADDGKCGFKIQEFTELGNLDSTPNGLFYNLSRGNLSWDYIRPAGPVNSQPFRYYDFIGYWPDAPVPVGEIGSSDIWLDLDYNGTIDYDTAAQDSRALGLADFSLGGTVINGNFYLGILLYKGNTFNFVTSESVIRPNSAISIPFQGNQSLGGEWNVVPFLSNRRYTLGQGAQPGVYASCFGIIPQKVTIHLPGTSVTFTINARWSASKTAVICSATVTNDTGSSITVRNAYIEFKYRPIGSTANPAECPAPSPSTVSLGDITVGARSSVTTPEKTVTLNPNGNSNNDFFARGAADGMQGSDYMQIEEGDDSSGN